jgi:hypothetical protein
MTRSRWSWSRTVAVTGVGALALGALASVGTAVSPSGTSAAAKQYPPQKGTLCHHTHSKKHPFVTITVSQRAFPAHLRHGDTIGPCPQTASTAAKATKTQKSRGKGDEHGRKQGHAVESPAPAVDGAPDTTRRGHSGTAPHAASPPSGGTPPGHGGTPPGRGTTAPGQSESPPAEVATPSSRSSPPGHGASPPHGGTPPGQGGTPPGQSGSPPGQAGTSPGHGGTPPGQGSSPPGGGHDK